MCQLVVVKVWWDSTAWFLLGRIAGPPRSVYLVSWFETPLETNAAVSGRQNPSARPADLAQSTEAVASVVSEASGLDLLVFLAALLEPFSLNHRILLPKELPTVVPSLPLLLMVE